MHSTASGTSLVSRHSPVSELVPLFSHEEQFSALYEVAQYPCAFTKSADKVTRAANNNRHRLHRANIASTGRAKYGDWPSGYHKLFFGVVAEKSANY